MSKFSGYPTVDIFIGRMNSLCNETFFLYLLITDQTRKLQMDYSSYSHRVRFTCFPTAEHSAKKGAIVCDSIPSVSVSLFS